MSTDTDDHKTSMQEAYEDGLARGREESWQAIRRLYKTTRKELERMGFDLDGIAGEANHWIYVLSILRDYSAAEALSMMAGERHEDTSSHSQP